MGSRLRHAARLRRRRHRPATRPRRRLPHRRPASPRPPRLRRHRLVFPQLGLTNLTADDFTTAYVYERVVADLRTRAKENKIQLVWTPVGDYAAVLRSTTSPTRGFTEIGRTDSRYATFLDTNVTLNVEYFYRLVVYAHSRPSPLGVSDARLAVSRPRDADNRPPAFLDTPRASRASASSTSSPSRPPIPRTTP
ncbi:MAG: hypothetical protein M5U12_21915 [Verrucomicrobia bacterium]|nr:hypothetical protein [Verrucomicrobiota bacterium]